MADYKDIVDSGERQNFDTGSVRDTNVGKGRYDLFSPLIMRRLAVHVQNGADKYGDRNWELGQPLGRFMDSAFRHMYKFLEGHRDEDHMAAAMWNIGAVIHVGEMIERGLLPKELDDLPNYLGEPLVCKADAASLKVLKDVFNPMKEKWDGGTGIDYGSDGPIVTSRRGEEWPQDELNLETGGDLDGR